MLPADKLTTATCARIWKTHIQSGLFVRVFVGVCAVVSFVFVTPLRFLFNFTKLWGDGRCPFTDKYERVPSASRGNALGG